MKTNFGQFMIQSLRETVSSPIVDDPQKTADYITSEILPHHTPDQENFFVLLLNTRRRILGYQHVGMGTVDQVLVHPREAFRAAIIGNAQAIILCHNHPSGDPTPSEPDIRLTRELKRAGDLLKIEVLDHIIMGDKAINPRGFASLREIGLFY